MAKVDSLSPSRGRPARAGRAAPPPAARAGISRGDVRTFLIAWAMGFVFFLAFLA